MEVQQQQAAGAQGAAGAAATTSAGAAAAGAQGTQQQAAGSAAAASGAQQQTTQTTQPNEAAKEAGAQQAKPGDQAPLALKLPDGAKPNPKLMEAFTKGKLSQEQAQGIVDFLTASGTEMEGALKQQLAKFGETLRADPDFGGANTDKTLAARDSALKQFGDDDTAKFLDEMGAKQHPGFTKMMARIRALVSEDAVGDKGDKPGAAATTEEARLRRMFPKSYDQMAR